MVESLSGWELDRWRAYHAVEPLPDVIWVVAQLCAVVANVNRTKGKVFTVDDFLPRIETKKKRRMSTREMQRNFQAATAGCK